MSSELPGADRALSGYGRRAGRLTTTNIPVPRLLAQVVLIGLVGATPWLFGGVQARVHLWLFAGAAAALVFWLLQYSVRGTRGGGLPWSLVPLLAALILGTVQLVPVRAELRQLLSPAASGLQRDLQPARDSADAAMAERLGVAPVGSAQPLSLYPASTRRDLAMLTLAVAVFLAGALVFKYPRAQIWLCGLIAVNGAALAFFGIVQKLTWNGMLYWTVPLTSGGRPFGPFVNRNNASGFLNLCLAGAVGLTVWAALEARRRFERDATSDYGPDRLRDNRSRSARLWAGVVQSVANLDGWTILGLSLAGCIAAGVLCSLSRGAGLALIGAAVVASVLFVAARRHAGWLWGMTVAAVLCLALVGWVGMSGSLASRVATLFDQEQIRQSRLPHWRDAVKAVPDFWLTGSGLGTYRYVYPMYQQRADELWYYHAENQYLEALVEGGLPGLALMMGAIALVGWAAWRVLRLDGDSRAVAMAAAAVFALASQAIHAFFDFGLYIPANMVLFALICGAVCGRAADRVRHGLSARFLALPPRFSPVPLVAALLLVGLVLGGLEVQRVSAVETALKSARFDEDPAAVPIERVEAALDRLAQAVEKRGDDAEAQFRMSALELHVYRLRALERLRKPPAPPLPESSLWQLTTQIVLHGRAHQFAQNKLATQLDALRDEPLVDEHLTTALEHLLLARRACPLFPEVHAGIAELCFLVGDPDEDQVHVERARRLAPGKPEILLRVGLIEFQAGRYERAWTTWRKCFAVSGAVVDDVLSVAERHLSPQEIVDELLPDSPELLIRLGRERYAGDEHAEMRRLLAERAEAVTAGAELPRAEALYLRASSHAIKGEHLKAITILSHAVELDPEAADWRYELAEWCRREGMLNEAHTQAVRCARMDPTNMKCQALLRKINRDRLLTSSRVE